jgi:hypothetical protein
MENTDQKPQVTAAASRQLPGIQDAIMHLDKGASSTLKKRKRVTVVTRESSERLDEE